MAKKQNKTVSDIVRKLIGCNTPQKKVDNLPYSSSTDNNNAFFSQGATHPKPNENNATLKTNELKKYMGKIDIQSDPLATGLNAPWTHRDMETLYALSKQSGISSIAIHRIAIKLFQKEFCSQKAI